MRERLKDKKVPRQGRAKSVPSESFLSLLTERERDDAKGEVLGERHGFFFFNEFCVDLESVEEARGEGSSERERGGLPY
jgi:hypothetical protein